MRTHLCSQHWEDRQEGQEFESRVGYIMSCQLELQSKTLSQNQRKQTKNKKKDEDAVKFLETVGCNSQPLPSHSLPNTPQATATATSAETVPDRHQRFPFYCVIVFTLVLRDGVSEPWLTWHLLCSQECPWVHHLFVSASQDHRCNLPWPAQTVVVFFSLFLMTFLLWLVCVCLHVLVRGQLVGIDPPTIWGSDSAVTSLAI